MAFRLFGFWWLFRGFMWVLVAFHFASFAFTVPGFLAFAAFSWVHACGFGFSHPLHDRITSSSPTGGFFALRLLVAVLPWLPASSASPVPLWRNPGAAPPCVWFSEHLISPATFGSRPLLCNIATFMIA